MQTKLIGFQDCLWRRKRKLSQNQKQIWKKAEFNQTKLDVFLTKPVTTYLDAKFAGKISGSTKQGWAAETANLIIIFS